MSHVVQALLRILPHFKIGIRFGPSFQKSLKLGLRQVSLPSFLVQDSQMIMELNNAMKGGAVFTIC